MKFLSVKEICEKINMGDIVLVKLSTPEQQGNEFYLDGHNVDSKTLVYFTSYEEDYKDENGTVIKFTCKYSPKHYNYNKLHFNSNYYDDNGVPCLDVYEYQGWNKNEFHTVNAYLMLSDENIGFEVTEEDEKEYMKMGNDMITYENKYISFLKENYPSFYDLTKNEYKKTLNDK